MGNSISALMVKRRGWGSGLENEERERLKQVLGACEARFKSMFSQEKQRQKREILEETNAFLSFEIERVLSPKPSRY